MNPRKFCALVLEVAHNGSAQERCVDSPFDVEFCHPWFLGEHRANELVDVFGRVRSDDAPRRRVFFERCFMLRLERRVSIIRVDVVADSHELLLVVGTREENDGHADEIGGRDAIRGRRDCLHRATRLVNLK